VHKTLVLALEEFFAKVDKTNTTLQLIFKSKRCIKIKDTIYEYASLTFH